jgi:hypothetical protein
VTASPPRRVRLCAAVAAAALLAGCSGGGKPKPSAAPTTTAPTQTPSPTPTPSPTKKALVSPFTGLPVDKLKPVIAIKVDNAPLARPQRGLDEADVVYEEAVEGRSTRFVAIFSSRAAKDIGPVRSARESDIPLLAQFGRIGLGFSGAQPGVLSQVRRAPNLMDASFDAHPGAYTIAGRRRDAYNFITGYDRILALAPSSAVAHDVGFRFGALPAKGTTAATSLDVVWSRYAHTQWRWNANKKIWVRYMDGAPAMLKNGSQQTAHTVIVQYATVRNSQFRDVHGVPSPYTTTTGTGKAIVLRDGKAIAGTWSRKGLGPTRFLDKAGKDIPLHTGPVWVMLVPNDLTARVT